MCAVMPSTSQGKNVFWPGAFALAATQTPPKLPTDEGPPALPGAEDDEAAPLQVDEEDAEDEVDYACVWTYH